MKLPLQIHFLGLEPSEAVETAAREKAEKELIQTLLALIAAWEPKINAMYRVLGEQALAEARASEARWRAGRPVHWAGA